MFIYLSGVFFPIADSIQFKRQALDDFYLLRTLFVGQAIRFTWERRDKRQKR